MFRVINKTLLLILVCCIQLIVSSALFAQQAGVKINDFTITEYLDRAEKALALDRLTTPPDDNAVAYIERALAVAPNNARAIHFLERVTQRYGELVSNSVKQGERVRRINLQRAKIYRNRAREVINEHGLSSIELQNMNGTIARYSQVPGDDTMTSSRAQRVSTLLVSELLDQHILLTELALHHNNVREAEWHVEQASELVDRYALSSVRLRPLKQEIMSASQGQEPRIPVEGTPLSRGTDVGKKQIKELIITHVQLGEAAFGRGDITLAKHHRDITVVLARQYGITDKALKRFEEKFADKGTKPILPWGFRVWGTF